MPTSSFTETKPTASTARSSRSRAAAAKATRAKPELMAFGPLLRLSMVLLLVLIVWAPVPLGSNRPWAVALLAGGVWAGVVVALVARAPGWLLGHWNGAVRKSALGLLLAFGCALWAALPLLLASIGHPTFSTGDPDATEHYVLRSLTYAGAMLLVALTLKTERDALWLLGALLAGGLVQSAVSAGLYGSGKSFVYWFTVISPGGRPAGTFLNPDHLAGYLEITLSAGVGLMLALMQPSYGQRGWVARMAALSTFVMSPKMLVRLSLVLLVMALVLTRSRAGNLAFLFSIFLVCTVVAWRTPQWRRPALLLLASMLVVDLVIIGQWVGLDAVVKRVQGTVEASSTNIASFGYSGNAPPPSEESLAERLTVPLSAVPLIQAKPVAGWGGGNFAQAYPPIKPDSVFVGFWDHAHNDYIEVAVDLGLVGLSMWLGLGVFSLWRVWPLLSAKASRAQRGVAVAALMALCCIAIHSVVDFNLQIPSNAMSFSVLLAVLWSMPGLPAPAKRTKLQPQRAKAKTREDDE